MKLFVRIPFSLFAGKWRELEARGLGCEVYLTASCIQREGGGGIKGTLSPLLLGNEPYTIHGPFRDLAPGTSDSLIRDATLRRMASTLDIFTDVENRPTAITFHSSFVPLLHEHTRGDWLKRSTGFWKELLSLFPSISSSLLLENVYDPSPSLLADLIDGVGDERLGICLDTGHVNVYSSSPFVEWFQAFGERIREVHLHDNMGEIDDHLPPGGGGIDFQMVRELMEIHSPSTIPVLEPVEEGLMEAFLRGAERAGLPRR